MFLLAYLYVHCVIFFAYGNAYHLKLVNTFGNGLTGNKFSRSQTDVKVKLGAGEPTMFLHQEGKTDLKFSMDAREQ